MSSIKGVHHTSLTVSDVDKSVAWYRHVLGFTPVRRWQSGDLDKAMLHHVDGGVLLGLVGHGAAAESGGFSERRPGLDHLGFAVADRDALRQWAQRLDSVGVAHSPITTGSSGELIAFRDPDDIALEFYTLA